MPETQKPFIRVKDKRTGHQVDIHRDRFKSEYHERVDRVEDSWHARPAKPSVTGVAPSAAPASLPEPPPLPETKPAAAKKRATKPTEKPAEPAAGTSTPEVVEGVSPEPVSAS